LVALTKVGICPIIAYIFMYMRDRACATRPAKKICGYKASKEDLW